MNRPPYERESADRALPLIRSIVRDARETYVSLRRTLTGLGDLRALEEADSVERLPEDVRRELRELRSYLAELRELGVVLVDPELGLVSLPGRLDAPVPPGPGGVDPMPAGAVVTYCWKLGEDRIRYWYPLGGRYEERRPLPPREAVAVAGDG